MTLRTAPRFVFLVFVALWFAAAPASAQSSAERKAAAEALFTEGRDLMKAGSYAAACEKFERSDALDSAPGTLLNLAECYEKVERFASAWATFKRAAAAARSRDQEKREAYARERADAIEPQLSYLTIQIQQPASGLQIARDGKDVPQALWGQAIPVDGGTITVRAEASGRVPWEQRIEVQKATDHVTVNVPELQPTPADGAPTPVEPAPPAGDATPSPGTPVAPDERKPNRTAVYVLGGVGATGLVLGGAFAGAAVASNRASEKHCEPENVDLCSPRGVELRDQARSFGNVSTVAVAVGLVGLAGATVTYLVQRPEPAREPMAERRVEWSPVASRDFGGIQLRGRW